MLFCYAKCCQGSVARVSFKNNKVVCNYYESISGSITNKTSQHKKILFMWHKLDHTRSVAPLRKTLEQVPEKFLNTGILFRLVILNINGYYCELGKY